MAREIVNPGDIPRIAVEPDSGSSFTGASVALGQLAAKFRDKAQTLSILRARREGAIAGTEGLTELKKGGSIQAQAFNDALNQNSMNRLQVQIRDSLVELEQDNPLDGGRFTVLSDQAIASRVEEMKKQDPELASALALRAASFQRSAVLRIRNATIGNEREQLRASVIEGETLNLTEIQQQTNSFFSEDTDIVAQAVASIAEAVADMERLWASPDPGGLGTLIPADKIVERRIATILGIYEQLISGFIRNHKQPDEVREALESGEFTMPTIGVNQLGEVLAEGEITVFNPKKDLPPEVFNRLVRLTRSEQGRRNQDAAGERELIRSTAVQTRDAILAGLRGPESISSLTLTDDEALAITRGDEVEADRLQSEIANEREIASFVPLVNAQSVQDTQDLIEAIVVQGLDAPEKLRMRGVFEAAQARKIAALRKDPFLHVRSTEFGRDATDAFESGAMDEPTYRRLMRDLQIATATGLRGFVPSVMSNDEALEVVTVYNAIKNEQDMIDGVSGLQQRFGTGRLLEFAVDDLEKAGLPPAVSQLIGLDSRRHEARVLARALTVGLSDLQKRLPEGVEKKDILREITTRFSEWERALPLGNDDLIQGKFDAMVLMATGLIVFDQYSDRRFFVGAKAESKAVSAAYDALIGSVWPSIVNDTLIIAEQDNEQIHAAAGPRGYARAIERVKDDIDPALADKSKTARFQYIEELLNSGRFVPDEDDEGFQFVDGLRRPVTSIKTGEQLTISFAELFDIGESVIVDELAVVSSAVPLESRQAIRAELVEAREEAREEIERQEETAQVKAVLLTLDPETGSVVKFLQSRGISLEGKSRLDIVREVKRIQDADRKE